MRIDHGCRNAFATQELLNSANIVSILQKICSEGVSKCVARHALCHSSGDDNFFHSFLDQRLIHVMSPLLSGFRVIPAFALGKNLSPFHTCVRILSVKGIRHPTVNPFLLSTHYRPHRFDGNISIYSANSLHSEEKTTRIRRAWRIGLLTSLACSLRSPKTSTKVRCSGTGVDTIIDINNV
jgi:hypothetical protein